MTTVLFGFHAYTLIYWSQLLFFLNWSTLFWTDGTFLRQSILCANAHNPPLLSRPLPTNQNILNPSFRACLCDQLIIIILTYYHDKRNQSCAQRKQTLNPLLIVSFFCSNLIFSGAKIPAHPLIFGNHALVVHLSGSFNWLYSVLYFLLNFSHFLPRHTRHFSVTSLTLFALCSRWCYWINVLLNCLAIPLHWPSCSLRSAAPSPYFCLTLRNLFLRNRCPALSVSIIAYINFINLASPYVLTSVRFSPLSFPLSSRTSIRSSNTASIKRSSNGPIVQIHRLNASSYAQGGQTTDRMEWRTCFPVHTNC